VHVYRYLMADTIEQRIDEILRSKVHLFEQLIDATSIDLSRLLSKRDLFELVGLEPPEAPTTEAPGLALENRVARLLTLQGYQVEQTARSRDGGVDVIAERTDAVGTRLRLLVQCKDTDRPVGVEVVRALNGVLPQGDRGTLGVLVCPSGFTNEAKTFAFARHIQLWDGAKMTELEQMRHGASDVHEPGAPL
jgi:hypothetical protein